MKATTWILAIIFALAAIIFGVLWVNSNGKIKALDLKNKELIKENETAAATINEIQSGLDSLDKDLLGQISPNGEVPGTPQDRRQRLLQNIATMRSQIEADKKRIATLESQLASSKSQLKGVQDMIAKLKNSVADKESILNQLQAQLGNLNQTLESERRTSAEEISKRDRAITDKQNLIDEQNAAQNTMYYITGTRKELIAKGIVDRKGGLLGIGKVSTVNSHYNPENFTMFNLANTNTITFTAKKGYAILSDQSAASYKVTKDGANYTLTITDPQNFRRHKYLVIELQ